MRSVSDYANGGVFTVTVTVFDDDAGSVADDTARGWVTGVRVDSATRHIFVVNSWSSSSLWSGMQLSLDWYQIEVEHAIERVSIEWSRRFAPSSKDSIPNR